MTLAEKLSQMVYPDKDGIDGICTTWLQRNAYVKGYKDARAEMRKKLFRMSLSSNAMDYVRGVGELLNEIDAN